MLPLLEEDHSGGKLSCQFISVPFSFCSLRPEPPAFLDSTQLQVTLLEGVPGMEPQDIPTELHLLNLQKNQDTQDADKLSGMFGADPKDEESGGCLISNNTHDSVHVESSV